MVKMTSYERIKRMYEHKEADRIGLFDSPWAGAVLRWKKEGMPENADFKEFFGFDLIREFKIDNSPRFPEKVVEETPEYKIATSAWGVTTKNFKVPDSTPEFLDFTINSPETWAEAKKRMTPDPDRIPWDLLKENYPKWQAEGAWIQHILWFGYDVTASWAVGTERTLMALVEFPEWCVDMFNHELDVNLKLLDMVWEKGYRFHAVKWYDDMGYKKNQFFSVNTYRELLKPMHARAIKWAKDRGVKAYLHSCGCITPFVPELIDIGLDMLNPLEVKAGIDPVEMKKKYGDRLAFHGGINATLWADLDKMEAEMEKVVPAMKEKGGYVFGSDHSIPSNVGRRDLERILKKAIELGSY